MSHPYDPAVSFNGGDLDCGNGLLLLIRQHIDPLESGQLLEILSTETSVREDLPAWCRLTGNELVNVLATEGQSSYLVSKGPFDQLADPIAPPAPVVSGKQGKKKRKDKTYAPITQTVVEPVIPIELPDPAPAPGIPTLGVMGVGSWPRPRWL